jgi:hypothetical protein
MTGIQFITDAKGRKPAAVIDLKKHRALWEDIEDGLVSESRRKEKGTALDTTKADLVKRGSVACLGMPLTSSRRRRKNSMRCRIACWRDGLAQIARPAGCKKLIGDADQWRVVYIINDGGEAHGASPTAVTWTNDHDGRRRNVRPRMCWRARGQSPRGGRLDDSRDPRGLSGGEWWTRGGSTMIDTGHRAAGTRADLFLA